MHNTEREPTFALDWPWLKAEAIDALRSYFAPVTWLWRALHGR